MLSAYCAIEVIFYPVTGAEISALTGTSLNKRTGLPGRWLL